MQDKELSEEVERAVQSFLEGHDRQANFHILIDCYYLKVRRFFSRRGLDRDDCLDLTQLTFLNVYKGLPGLEDRKRFPGYLFKTARNTLFRWSRRAVKKSEREHVLGTGAELEELVPASEGRRVTGAPRSPCEAFVAAEIKERVQAAVALLPDRQRQCMELHLLRFRNREISASLKISQGTVSAHLFQARQRLRKDLEELWESDGVANPPVTTPA